MHRALRLSLGVAGVLFAVACSDQPGSVRSPMTPTEPSLTVTGTSCTTTIYNALSDKAKVLFSGTVLKAITDLQKDMKQQCGKSGLVAASFAYVAGVIANKATEAYVANVPISAAGQVRAQGIADLIDNALVYGGVVTTSGIPYKALLPGGGAKVCGQTNPGGECVLITEGYIVAGIVQKDLIAPTGSHLYMLSPGNCTPTNLKKEAFYCIDLSSVPSAANYNPDLQGFVCTTDQDHAVGGGDENDPLVNVSHGVNGTTEVLKHPATGTASTALLTPCTHGTQPTYASAGFGGAMERVFARAVNVVRPKMLYAINAGPTFGDDFSDGFSPLGAVNRGTFQEDFQDDVVGSAPGTPLVGQTWQSFENGAGTIRVQGSSGGEFTKPVVLNQAQGCTSNCGELKLVGSLQEENGAVADVGVYTLTFESLQDRPTIDHADFVLRSTTGFLIARLRYATTLTGVSQLQYETAPGVFTPVGTWTVHTKQSFEITIDINHKTTTLNIGGGTAEATNVPFLSAAADWRFMNWENGGTDSGKTAFDNIVVVRQVDP